MMTFGIDWDDTLCPLVEHCCKLANEENDTNYVPEDITSWGYTGSPAIEAVSRHYGDDRAYALQEVAPHAKYFMKELQKRGDVYIITAIEPRNMSIRAAQIKAAFPDFPDDHIIMGAAKSLVHFDVTLDDAPHNILKSCAKYPVLFRQPWNQKLSGVLSVNNYEEFLTLIDQIKESMAADKITPKEPSVIALVGPSGSNKNAVATALSQNGFGKRVYTKRCKTSDKIFSDAITKTVYGGYTYYMNKADVEEILVTGNNVIVVVDICGAMALKRRYATTLVFCKRNREDMIGEILEADMENEEKKIRLLSMENELKNEKLCHISVRTENVASAAKEIQELYK